jgi:hypothetical protein
MVVARNAADHRVANPITSNTAHTDSEMIAAAASGAGKPISPNLLTVAENPLSLSQPCA